jgi:hypothetical protein
MYSYIFIYIWKYSCSFEVISLFNTIKQCCHSEQVTKKNSPNFKKGFVLLKPKE